MRTRFLMALISAMVILSFLSAGGNTQKGCISANDQSNNTAVSDTSVSDTSAAAETENQKDNYPPVAPETITLEDGTGIISLGMHRDEVAKQFDEWNLDYTLDYRPEISKYSDIIYNYGQHQYYQYLFDPDGILCEVYISTSPKGLELGDSLSKMTEIYGDDCEYDEQELEGGGKLRDYYYNSPDGVKFIVEVFYQDGDGSVLGMFVSSRW